MDESELDSYINFCEKALVDYAKGRRQCIFQGHGLTGDRHGGRGEALLWTDDDAGPGGGRGGEGRSTGAEGAGV